MTLFAQALKIAQDQSKIRSLVSRKHMVNISCRNADRHALTFTLFTPWCLRQL